MAQPSMAASTTPQDAAEGTAPATHDRGLGHEPPEEEHRLRPFPEHTAEGDQADDPEPVTGKRLFDAPLDVTLHRARMLAHPPSVPGEHDDGQEP